MKNFKKFMLLMATAVLFVLAAVGLAACGDDDADLSQYAGAYKVESVTRSKGINQDTYNVGDSLEPGFGLPNEFGQSTLTDDYIVIVLNADGTATVNSKIPASLGGFQGEKTGNWTIDKNEIIEFKALSDNMTSVQECSLSYNDGKLRFWCMLAEMNYVEYTLSK